MSKKNNDIQEEKMSIYEYEQKYSKRQNVKGAKTLLRSEEHTSELQSPA